MYRERFKWRNGWQQTTDAISPVRKQSPTERYEGVQVTVILLKNDLVV